MKEKVILVSFMLIVLVIFSACGSNWQNDEIYERYVQQIEDESLGGLVSGDNEGSEKLRLVITGSFVGLALESIQYIMSDFMEHHPNIELVLDNYPDKVEFLEIFPVLLMTRKLGDIIYLPRGVKFQMISPNHFYELSPYIYENPELKHEEYFMNILTSAQTKDGLFDICTSAYPVSDFMLRKDLSEEFTELFESSDAISFNEMIEMYFELSEINGPDWGYSFIDFFSPTSFLLYNLDKLVDFENKRANFTDPEFMELMEKVKKKIPVSGDIKFTEAGQVGKYSGTTSTIYQYMFDPSLKLMFLEGYALGYENTLVSYSDSIFTQPRSISMAEGHYLFTCLERLAIHKKCAAPDAAWSFIQYVLSEKDPSDEWEEDHLGRWSCRLDYMKKVGGMGFSTNKANFEKKLQLDLDIAFFSNKKMEEEGHIIDGTDEEYRHRVRAHVYKKMEESNYNDQKFNDLFVVGERGIIWDDFYLYLMNKQDVKKTMRSIERKVNLWLNE